MQPLVFREARSSRRRFRGEVAFFIAFIATMLISVVALGIWDDVPQKTNELAWSEVPPVRIWTFFLILLGTPALAVLLAFAVRLPAGQTLIVDEEGIRRRSKLLPGSWRWHDIEGLEIYPHPDGKSFIKVAISGADEEVRITDIYEPPLAEIFDQLLALHARVTGAPAPRTDVAADQEVTYHGDPGERIIRPYAMMAFLLIIGFFSLHGVFDFPPALSIGGATVAVLLIIYQVVGIVRVLSTGGRRKLVLDESGLSLVAGGRQDHIAWSDIADIRLHGRTGFWATPRYIALEKRSAGRPPGLAARLLGSSRLVIPDAFLASMDEIADRLNGFRERLGQRQG